MKTGVFAAIIALTFGFARAGNRTNPRCAADDYFAFKFLNEVAFSPDGSTIALRL